MTFSPNLKINSDVPPIPFGELPKQKPKYSGGRYLYFKWKLDLNGNRIAVQCKRDDKPDLQSTYFVNEDGLETIRYIRLDIDANKTLPCWKDESGAVDWFKIAPELNHRFPNISAQIEYVMRSHSKKGIHILIGLAPLPLTDKTTKTQFFIRKIQANLIDIFTEIGVGADPAGKGLKNFFSSFRVKENIIHSNAILTKRIEKSAKNFGGIGREKFLNRLNKACESALDELEIRNGYRLYHDMRLEPKIAKLYLFALGMYQPLENITDIDVKPSYAHLNSVDLTLDQIAQIMGTEKRNIYKQFWLKDEIQKLFHIENNIDGTKRITVRDSKNIVKRIQRARAIWNYEPSEFNLNLVEPWLVCDGMRNTAIVSWAIALKWHGVTYDLALAWISLLVKQIPGYKESSSCKKSQIKATVQSIFRNREETYGIMSDHPLPDWLNVANMEKQKKDQIQCEKQNLTFLPTTISPSRNILGFLSTEWVMRQGLDSRNLLDSFQGLSEGSVMVNNWESNILLEKFQHKGFYFISNENETRRIEIPLPSLKNKLRVVTYNQRVGFFLNGQLLLCLIRNRHYKLTPVLNYIENNILKDGSYFDALKDVIHVRHNSKAYKELALKLYEESVLYLYAQQICGNKLSYAESLEIYDLEKAGIEGVSLEKYREKFYKDVSYKKSFLNPEMEVVNEIPF